MQFLGGLIWLFIVVVNANAFAELTISWPFFVQHTTNGDRIEVSIDSKNTLIIFNQKTTYRAGDRVQLKGRFNTCQPPRNPGQFDFCRWQQRHGIQQTFFVTGHLLSQSSLWPQYIVNLTTIPAQLYQQCQLLFNHHHALIYTMIFGDRENYVSRQIKTSFLGLGLIHLLVVSGAQIGLLTMSVFFLSRVCYLPNAVTFLILIVLQFFYVLITGLDASILRSLIMTNVFLVNNYILLKRYPHWWYLMLAVLVVLLFNKFSIFMPGFWYSFLITCSLIYGLPFFLSKINGPQLFIGYFIANVIAVLIAIPIQLIQTSYLQPFSLIANLWVSWMSTIILFGGTFLLLISFVSLPVAQFFSPALDYIANVMVTVSNQLFLLMPGVYLDRLTIWSVIFSMILIILCYYYPTYRLTGTFLVIGITCITFVYLSNRQMIVAIDVGQGDATLIVNGFDAFLVDSGGFVGDRSIAQSTIIPVLNYYGIDSLRALVITHHDLDHIGGLGAIFNRGLEAIYSPFQLNLNHHIRVVSSVNLLGPNFSLSMISPQLLGDDLNSNNQSLLVTISFESVKFMITGDMDHTVELAFIRQEMITDVDVLKLGHHGSRFSTSDELLKQTSPIFIWNSAGSGNQFSHPHPDVIERIGHYQIPYLSTHKDGAIQFLINDRFIRIRSFLTNKTFLCSE